MPQSWGAEARRQDDHVELMELAVLGDDARGPDVVDALGDQIDVLLLHRRVEGLVEDQALAAGLVVGRELPAQLRVCTVRRWSRHPCCMRRRQ